MTRTETSEAVLGVMASSSGFAADRLLEPRPLSNFSPSAFGPSEEGGGVGMLVKASAVRRAVLTASMPSYP